MLIKINVNIIFFLLRQNIEQKKLHFLQKLIFTKQIIQFNFVEMP